MCNRGESTGRVGGGSSMVRTLRFTIAWSNLYRRLLRLADTELVYVQWDLVLECLRSILVLVKRVVEVLSGVVEAM